MTVNTKNFLSRSPGICRILKANMQSPVNLAREHRTGFLCMIAYRDHEIK